MSETISCPVCGQPIQFGAGNVPEREGSPTILTVSQVVDHLKEGQKTLFYGRDIYGHEKALFGCHIPGTTPILTVGVREDAPDTLEVVLDAIVSGAGDRSQVIAQILKEAAEQAEEEDHQNG